MANRLFKGFTLIELSFAMAIIAILATISYMAVPPYLNRAFDTRRKDNLHNIKINLEIYFDEAEQYPKELPDCGEPLTYKNQTIMRSMFCDPVTKQPYYYQVKGDEPESYRLYALLSNDQDISIAIVGCLGGCGPKCFYNYGVYSANTSLIKCSYVCAPGGGKTGSCELYQDTGRSLCPKIYNQDSTCNNECKYPINRCKNASGKNIPF